MVEIDLNLPASRVIRVLERQVAWRGGYSKEAADGQRSGLCLSHIGWLAGPKSMELNWSSLSLESQHKIRLLNTLIENTAMKYSVCIYSIR